MHITVQCLGQARQLSHCDQAVMAILHDETVDPSQGELLKDGDELSLLPPMSGG